MPEGAPPRGTPGGHVGEHIWFASCTACRAEWVWVAAGIPSSMTNCGCDSEHVVVIQYAAQRYGRENEMLDGSPRP